MSTNKTKSRPRGTRLANPNDPAVRMALRTECPICQAPQREWCVGVSGTRMRGRRLTRIHSGRAEFIPNPPGSQTGTGL